MTSTAAPRLRQSMLVGAAYDAAVGLSIVLALKTLSTVLPIPFPAEPFYARMQGVLLLGLATFYAFAAHDLERNLRNVAGAIAIRGLGGAYLLVWVLAGEIAPFFAVFGGIDLGFALWHLLLLRGERHARFWPLLLRGRETT